MSLFSRLFGSSAKPGKEPEIYKDFRIFPEPQRAAGGYRVAARIEKDLGGETKVHQLMRADTLQTLEEAEAFSIRKAKQVIDEQGERIFG
ncbi:HlyU family transcriptional regulator [Roseicyclus marinus]|uniref:Transcriptional activator HlyU n=1 Tax=Roseicyclus marinus TaxID=2161673 RepID=A0AA48H9N9_9RHOB|nr:transcriptional activator HlyU [Roseicyclus marinus]